MPAFLNLTPTISALRDYRFALYSLLVQAGSVVRNDVKSTGWLTWESAKKIQNSFPGKLNDLQLPGLAHITTVLRRAYTCLCIDFYGLPMGNREFFVEAAFIVAGFDCIENFIDI